jgi:hypothetical protein
MQAWMINTRREKYQDVRLREAFACAFDFEWANKNLMFDTYARTQSCFQNSDMMAKGKPSPEELALLKPHEDKLRKEVFGEVWTPPVSDGSGQDRRLLRKSAELLNAAGWTIKEGKRLNAKGEPLTVEFLAFERVSEPHHALYIKNLTALGVEATVRVVDPVQYRSRMQDFDFDISMNRIALPLTPGDSLRAYFSSKSADGKGSPNFSGIANPVVDALIEKAVAAGDRHSLNVWAVEASFFGLISPVRPRGCGDPGIAAKLGSRFRGNERSMFQRMTIILQPPAHNRRSMARRPSSPCSVQLGEGIGGASAIDAYAPRRADRYVVLIDRRDHPQVLAPRTAGSGATN